MRNSLFITKGFLLNILTDNLTDLHKKAKKITCKSDYNEITNEDVIICNIDNVIDTIPLKKFYNHLNQKFNIKIKGHDIDELIQNGEGFLFFI